MADEHDVVDDLEALRLKTPVLAPGGALAPVVVGAELAELSALIADSRLQEVDEPAALAPLEQAIGDERG